MAVAILPKLSLKNMEKKKEKEIVEIAAERLAEIFIQQIEFENRKKRKNKND
ncbi:MAG: hypothetical protein ABIG40_00885 [Parcubacteria group bacterium]